MKSLRLQIEIKTIKKMVALYCRKQHHSMDQLCPECQELLNYSLKRIDCCPFGTIKPACSECTVHCYKRDRQEQIKKIMRYSGPRMMLYHPIYAIIHIMIKILPFKTALSPKK